jgi:hypothetical protein
MNEADESLISAALSPKRAKKLRARRRAIVECRAVEFGRRTEGLRREESERSLREGE